MASAAAHVSIRVSGLALSPIVRIAVAAPNVKYHGPSHDSQRRLVPGAGGDSANNRPPGSCLPALQKLSPDDVPRRGCVPVANVLPRATSLRMAFLDAVAPDIA